MLTNIRNYFFAMAAFFLPTLLANTYYIDDNGRSIEGYYNWGIDGRPLAEGVMKWVMLKGRAVDIFPLNIIISCLVLALAFSVLRAFLNKSERISKWTFPLPLLIAFNIFYMEPAYYRFDSITISLSIAISVLSSVYFLKGKWDYLTTTVATIATLSLYQTSVNLIMLLSVANAVLLAIRTESFISTFKALMIKGLSVVSGAIIYFAFILPYYVLASHGADHPGVNVSTALSNLYVNFVSILNIISSYISLKHGSAFMASIFVLAVASCIILSWRLRHKSVLLAIFIALSPLVCLVLMAGVSLTLDNILSSPRIYTSFGAMQYFCFAVFCLALPQKAKLVSLISVPFLIFPLIVNYAYGNAMKAQDARNIQTLNEIGDATGVSDNDAKIKIIFNGDYPYAAVTQNTLTSFPVLRSLIPNYFTNWWWSFQFMRRNGYNYDFPAGKDVSYAINELAICSVSEVKKTKDFDAYIKDGFALIDFTKKSCSQ